MRSNKGGRGAAYRLSNGRTDVDPRYLYETKPGRWEQPAPRECPNGHPLGPRQVIVGTQSCPAVPGSGQHLIHRCARCEDAIYTPPETPDCDHRAFDSR